MAAANPKLRLFYFDGRGRAEIIRYIFAQGNVAYEDVRIQGKDWPNEKAKMPFGQMPVLQVDDFMLAQSNAIERYAGKIAGLYGKDALEQAKIDMVIEALHDTAANFMKANYSKDEADKKAQFEAYFKNDFPKWCGYLENCLKANNGGKGFFVGDSVSIADIHFYGLTSAVLGAKSDALSGHQLLADLKDRVAKLDRIAAWEKKRPQTAF